MTLTHPSPGWYDRIPKVELHLHLEGAIPYAALWELIQKYGGDPETPTLETMLGRFDYKDFPHFIETWIWKNQFLREYEDFTFIAEAVANDLIEQNIRYVETFYSPPDFTDRHGLITQKLTEAIHIGFSRVPEVEINLVADLVRDFGPEKAAVTLAEVNEVKELGVIGIGIGGSEQDFPPEPFREVYEQARQFGFHTSAHAGEVAGAESVWGALRSLEVERVGHGARAEEDPALLDYLTEHRIPLEMCPLSNLRTGVVKSLDEHPVRRYFDRGLMVTINSDDPKMFGNSLAEEYWLLERQLGFTRDEIRTLILQGIQASWMTEEAKARMAASFRSNPSWEGES
ncbi:MAG: adenosine deaminase [Chloroflexi bacterium]|nr:adenosine deaminase [Chloroflexota bacterium]